MKVLCSHLLNGIMDQALGSVCVDLLNPFHAHMCFLSHMCLHLWMALVSVMFIFGSDILVKAFLCLLCVCSWSRGMTNMSIRRFSARTMQFKMHLCSSPA